VGNEFYSVDYPPLRKLHHDYIIHVLDELGDLPSVIFTVAYQYAGPLAFEQFFQDTIAEWEKQHGHSVRVALITSKGITDAILSDPVRSKQIAAVDMRYWYYLSDGTLFAPEAGQNRAYRDMIASQFGGNYSNGGPPTTDDQVYRQVREYRDRYPNVALLPLENGAGPLPILMAGGVSLSAARGNLPARGAAVSNDGIIDRFIHDYLANDLMKMTPVDGVVAEPQRNWVLGGDTAILIYSRSGEQITLVKGLVHSAYEELWFDPVSGQVREGSRILVQAGTNIPKPDSKPWLLLLRPDN
jgi:hypothetical protein